jgi:ribonuclease G
MNIEFVVDVDDAEITIALLEDRQLVELHKERRDVSNFAVGSIYIGRVKKIMPGLNAAFVDVGYSKDAFLHYTDLGVQFPTFDKYVQGILKRRTYDFPKIKLGEELPKYGKIEDVLTVGQPILVQIAKEPIASKGPRLSAEIVIAARNLVLVPFSEKFFISQKIHNTEEKQRLKSLCVSIVPKNFGAIIRTAGEGKKVATLDSELQSAMDNWHDYLKRMVTSSTAPCLIAAEMSRASVILRDLPVMNVSSVYINDRMVYNATKEYLTSIAPEKAQAVKYYTGSKPILEHFDLVKLIKSGFGRYVTVKNGIYLVIDHTEALHVIDVNSGIRATNSSGDKEKIALDVNMAAAEEIVRQIRLRDMGGIIVIDFIDLYKNESRAALYEHMIKLMMNDRSKHKILPLSKFGLMQITRMRVRPETHILTSEECPSCNGTGKIGPSIVFDRQVEAQISHFVKERKLRRMTIQLHPYAAAYLRVGIISRLLKWCIKYRCLIKITESQNCAYLEVHYFDDKNIELVLEGKSLV